MLNDETDFSSASIFINDLLGGVVVESLPRVREVLCLILGRVISKTFKMVVMAALLQDCGVSIMTDLLVLGFMEQYVLVTYLGNAVI